MSKLARTIVQHARTARFTSALARPIMLARPLASLHSSTFAASPFALPRRSFFSPPGSKAGLISTQPSPDGKGTIPVVLVADAKKIWKDFEAIVDVREPKEVAEGIIPGAVNIPLGQVEAQPNQTQLKGKKVLVYCRAGIRSAKAVAALQGAGIDAVNLGGGYLAWQGDQ